MRIECDLGWADALVKQLEALRAALTGEAEAAMAKVLAAVKAAPAKSPLADKMRADLATFSLTLEYVGPKQPVPCWGTTLSTQPIDKLATPAYRSFVVIDEKQAGKIVDWLEKDGFFERGVTAFKKPLAGPCYVLSVFGGAQVMGSLGWGDALVKELESLRGALDGDAAKAMDKVIESVKR
jgi:hypothetical protein